MPASRRCRQPSRGRAGASSYQFVRTASAADEGHGVPRDGRKLCGIETHRAVERVVVVDVVLQFQTGEIRSRREFHAAGEALDVDVPARVEDL